MGGGGSTMRNEIINRLHYEQTTKFLQTTFSRVTSRVEAVNGMTIVFDAEEDLVWKNVTFGQTQSVNVTVINSANSSLSLQELTELQNAIENDCELTQNNLAEDVGGIFAPLGNGNDASTTMKNEISQVIKTEITQETITETVTENFSVNDLVLTVKARNISLEDIHFTQDIMIEVVAKGIVENVLDSVLDRTSMTDILNRSESSQINTNTGINTIIGTFGDIITSPAGVIIIIVIIIGCCVGAYFLVKMRTKGASAALGAASSGGGLKQAELELVNMAKKSSVPTSST